MGGLRTFWLGMVLVLAPLTGWAGALPDLAATFATCAGRYSAQMEHAWLVGDSGDIAKARRAQMVALLDTITTPEIGRDVLARRIEAKVAQRQLLTQATFNDDRREADWAARRAEIEIAFCDSLLLG